MTDTTPLDDFEWAKQRVEVLAEANAVEAGCLGPRLLKGHGYPNEAFSHAMDALALRIMLTAFDAQAEALAALRKDCAAARAKAQWFGKRCDWYQRALAANDTK